MADNKPVPHCPCTSNSCTFYNPVATGMGAQRDAPALGNGTYGLVLVLAASLEISGIGGD